jgi:hypothetical protein
VGQLGIRAAALEKTVTTDKFDFVDEEYPSTVSGASNQASGEAKSLLC